VGSDLLVPRAKSMAGWGWSKAFRSFVVNQTLTVWAHSRGVSRADRRRIALAL
jgi:hypothetical protein